MAPASVAARLRARGLERELAALRPLGEAYALRRFGDSLSRADAEDAVAEVVIRLHRRIEAGKAPDNLRAAFFTSVRNAAIDQLRSRAARPTVALDAAAELAAPLATPAERAEGREDAARLQEALARMRGNYREAIMLRFGLGMTVPEMASHLGISLPAAKKLVLRATKQVRLRMEEIEGAHFCDQMREIARDSLAERHAAGLAEEAEAVVLQAHFSHCGSCRAFLARLHDSAHELGSAALLGLLGGAPLHGRLGPLARLGHWAEATLGSAQAGAARVRHVAYKAGGAFSAPDAGSAGALVGASQKVAAICATGAVSAATCVLGAGLSPGVASTDPPPRPASAAQAAPAAPAAEAQSPLPTETTAESVPAPEPNTGTPSSAEGASSPAPAPPSLTPAEPSPQAPSPAPEPESAPSGEFGVEASAPGSASESGSGSAPPAAAARPASEGPSAQPASGFRSAPAGGGVGFQG